MSKDCYCVVVRSNREGMDSLDSYDNLLIDFYPIFFPREIFQDV